MGKLASALLGCCVLFVSNNVFADNDLKALLKNIQTMEADFKQTVYSEHNQTLHEYAGHMAFKKPSFFRWEVRKPDQMLLVTNGNKLWNYDVDLEQVTIEPYAGNKEITPLSFILDDHNQLTQNFRINSLKNNCYNLTPLVENANFVDVQVCFAQNKLVSVNVLDHLGQNSKFEFSAVKNNINIADRRFTFVPPAGVDVVGE